MNLRFGGFTHTVLLVSLSLCLAPIACTEVLATGLVGLRSAHDGAVHQAATSIEAREVRIEDTSEAAKLSFDVTAAVDATAFVLSGPDRVVVDLPQVDFRIDPQVGKIASTAKGHAKGKLVGSFRFGLLASGRSRIVLDLDRPARIVFAGSRMVAGKPRLVVQLARSDQASFASAAKSRTLATSIAADGPNPQPSPGKPTIVIDAGHGGPDTGAMANGVIEKDVTLAFAKSLADRLDRTGRFNVVLTRSSDVFIALSERVRIARSANAALMISIHADTLPETADVSGATVYTVSDRASDAYAAKVAAKENEVDADVGVDGHDNKADVNDILFDLTRQETRAYSHVFSRTLVSYWKAVGHLNKNPQRAAGFVVLKAPDVPSVLLELGYLSNPGDSRSLSSDEWRATATTTMADAVVAYFADQHGQEKAAAGVPMPFAQAHSD